MRLDLFFGDAVTQGFLTTAIRADVEGSQAGNYASTLFPRVFQDVTEIKKRVISLARPIIAADVAPLSTGRFGKAMSKQEISGNLIDSAARYHYVGKEIEDLRALMGAIEALPGESVSLRAAGTNQALEAYYNFMSVHVIEPILMNANRKDWTLLRTGKAWADNSRDDDFTRPALISMFDPTQTEIVVAGNARNIYGGVSADFLTDAQDAVNRAKARGYRIREVIMNSNTRQQILGLPSTQQAVGGMTLNVVTGGQVEVQMQQANATTEAFNAALAQRSLPPVRIEDGFWQDQVREDGDPAGPVGTYVLGQYVPDGVVIFVPDNTPEQLAFLANESLLSGLVNPIGNAAAGIHLFGRPTAQDEGPKIYTFGPYYERSERPSIRGSGIAAHMPFLAGPAGFEVIEYAKQ